MDSHNGNAPGSSHVGLVQEISSLIHKHTGIQLGEKQMAMVESRLKRRSYEVGLNGLDEYPAYFAAHRASETEALISLLTTHHTFFFREFVQFEFLEQRLPELVKSARARGSRTLNVYSAACSRGQEVYSLAMFLDKHLKEFAPDFDYRIFGTDVDGASVEVARNGVYRRDEIKSVPLSYLGEHWARGSGEIADFVKAKRSIRDRCEFAKVNLLDLSPIAAKKFDVIFCRNVFIYFTPVQIKQIAGELIHSLEAGGLFFVGVSESLHSLNLPIKAVGSSIYVSASSTTSKESGLPSVKLVAPAFVSALPNPLRVVCVDDSASILTLLKRVLGRDQGFEVVGTAVNGNEAESVVARCKPDLITLDIHMPVQTGIEFLQAARDRGGSLPPVVMVTSVSRDDAGLAWKALQLGASDYVEKPALHNLEQRAEEIRTKLRSAYRARGKTAALPLDQQFARRSVIPDPLSCATLLALGMGDLDRCMPVLRELLAAGIPTYLALEGADSLLPAVAEKLSRETGKHIGLAPGEKAPALVGNLSALAPQFRTSQAVAIVVYGEVTKTTADALTKISEARLFLEDLGDGRGASLLSAFAADIVLPTSFSYLCLEYFARAQARRKSA